MHKKKILCPLCIDLVELVIRLSINNVRRTTLTRMSSVVYVLTSGFMKGYPLRMMHKLKELGPVSTYDNCVFM